jgi:hypothetical protein
MDDEFAALDFVFHPVERVEDALRGAGVGEVESTVRDAYPEEHPSRRAYVFARKPAADA